MNEIPCLQEVEILYSNKIKLNERIKISSSHDAAEVFRKVWNNSIEYRESAYVILLDGYSNVLGYHLVSFGGKTSTVVDIPIVMQVALKSNANGIILAHNHPSGQLNASEQDKHITKALKDACKILGLRLFDHVILTAEGYTSFLDEGDL